MLTGLQWGAGRDVVAPGGRGPGAGSRGANSSRLAGGADESGVGLAGGSPGTSTTGLAADWARRAPAGPVVGAGGEPGAEAGAPGQGGPQISTALDIVDDGGEGGCKVGV